MIRTLDALTLAVTKLRTRKFRLAVTVIMASLLLSILTFGVTVVRGVLDSTQQFTSSGLADRYIVNVMEPYTNPPYEDAAVIARANAIHAQLVADKKAEAKRLGIDYDASSEPKPTVTRDNITSLDMQSPSAQKAVAEYNAAKPSTASNLEKALEPYNHKAIYSLSPSVKNGTVTVMKDGKESFTTEVTPKSGFSLQRSLAEGWNYTDTSVVESFLLTDEQIASQKDKQAIPVVAPYSDVEKALGLQPLPKTATSVEKRDRIAYVRDNAENATFTICYRNQASKQQIDDAIRVAKEIEDNKANKNYQKPELIYSLPAADSCAAAGISRDVRTADQKKLEAKQLEFTRKFDGQVDPDQQKVTFRVVGVSPDAPSFESFSGVQAIIQTIAGSSLQGMWVVPQSLYDQIPDKKAYDRFDPAVTKSTTATAEQSFFGVGTLVEFKTPDDARAFYDAKNCMELDCSTSNKFMLSYFGSNSIVISDMEKGFTTALQVVGGIVALIAALIMMGMVGRIMTDSRRETAVFRAIGAKRNDIRAVYYTYTLLLSLVIAATSILIGVGLAAWLNSSLVSEATIQAQLAFGTKDTSLEFAFFGIWTTGLLSVVGIVVLAGFVGVLLPLSRNVSRNPINDMRDDR